MGRAFSSEIELLPGTYEWALDKDLGSLPQTVAATLELPIVAIGSGGSFVGAALVRSLHFTATGLLSVAMTPLEASELRRSVQRFAVWLLSARGRNSDVISAYEKISQLEPDLLSLICASPNSPLARKMSSSPETRVFDFQNPAGKDGFLATNSLLATAVLLFRSYSTLPTFTCDLPTTLESLLSTTHVDRRGDRDVWQSSSFIALYSASTQIASIAIESAFSEAGLGGVLPADFRNFAHGRHHWLTRFDQSTSVIAFIAKKDRELFQATLDLVPSSIPRVVVSLDDNELIAQLQCIILALHLTAEAGAAKSLDPGQPAVAEFGRRLYHLSTPKPRKSGKASTLTSLAIERKARRSVGQLEVLGQLQGWLDARISFTERLWAGNFGAVVFDLDGTLLSDRYGSLDPKIVEIIDELVNAEVGVGVATGRGDSARTLLRKHLPNRIWKKVVIGYYNGSEVGLLSDDLCPIEGVALCDELVPVMRQLEMAQLDVSIHKSASRYQITMRAERSGLLIRSDELWHIAQEASHAAGRGNVTVVKSTHSVDILAPGTSKAAVEERLKKDSNEIRDVLKIGDMGEYPGNDFDLLNSWSGLSVDRVSISKSACWNLLPIGYRGIKGTLRYLESLQLRKGRVTIRKDAII